METKDLQDYQHGNMQSWGPTLSRVQTEALQEEAQTGEVCDVGVHYTRGMAWTLMPFPGRVVDATFSLRSTPSVPPICKRRLLRRGAHAESTAAPQAARQGSMGAGKAYS